jgi:hypothetical protein
MTVGFHLNALQHILRTGIQIPKFYTYMAIFYSKKLTKEVTKCWGDAT